MFGIYYFESCKTSKIFVEPSKSPKTSFRKETKLLSVVSLYCQLSLSIVSCLFIFIFYFIVNERVQQKNLEKNELKKVPFF